MTAVAASTDTRSRAIEFGAAAALHVALVGGLSLALLAPPKPPPPPPASMDVTIADDVGLTASAPQSETPPAPSQAPDLGPPDDSAPPAPSVEPEPAPAKPQPAEPAPAPKPAEVAKPQPVRKVAPAPPQPARPQARPAPSGALARVVGQGSGATPGAKIDRPRGSTLGGVISGLGATPTPSRSTTPQGATMTGPARADIGSRIADQIRPCGLRQSLNAPGVDRIRVIVVLSFDRDGTFSAAPRIARLEGVDGDNERYADQVRQRALAVFNDQRCQPIRGLPADLYDVPGGWRNYTIGFRLPG